MNRNTNNNHRHVPHVEKEITKRERKEETWNRYINRRKKESQKEGKTK